MTTTTTTDLRLDLPAHGLPGRLIAFTGLKGTGKSTLAQRMIGHLADSGITAVHTKQHTDEFYDYPIFTAYVTDTDSVESGAVDIAGLSLISLGDTVQKVRTTVLPLLAQGTWVLLDRYLIDQVAGFPVFRDDPAELAVLRSVATLLPAPDLAFFIDADGAVAIDRIRRRGAADAGLDYDADFYDRNNQAFAAFAAANGWTVLADASSPEALFDSARPHLDGLLAAREVRQ